MAVSGAHGAAHLAPGKQIGELRLTALDELISHFRYLDSGADRQHSARLVHRPAADPGIVAALQSITEVVHDIRENRHFRRVPEERIEEFHLFARL